MGAVVAGLSMLGGPAYAGEAAIPRLTGTVGPGQTISLVNARGRRVKRLRPGEYRIVVRDRSTRENFHLLGPGITGFAGSTSIPLRQTVSWKLHLSRGTYRYRSDTNPNALHGSFRVG